MFNHIKVYTWCLSDVSGYLNMKSFYLFVTTSVEKSMGVGNYEKNKLIHWSYICTVLYNYSGYHTIIKKKIAHSQGKYSRYSYEYTNRIKLFQLFTMYLNLFVIFRKILTKTLFHTILSRIYKFRTNESALESPSLNRFVNPPKNWKNVILNKFQSKYWVFE